MGMGPQEMSGAGIDTCKDFISSLLWMSFFPDNLFLIFHWQGGIWEPYSPLIYQHAIWVTQRFFVAVPSKERILLVEPHSAIHSWGKSAIASWEGLQGCQEHSPLDGLCLQRGISWRGRSGSKGGTHGTDTLRACATIKRELILGNITKLITKLNL